MDSPTPHIEQRIEICSSCARAAGLVKNAEERTQLIQSIQSQVDSQNPQKSQTLQIQWGQCQRLCQDGHITLAHAPVIHQNTNQSDGSPIYGPATLSMTPEPTEASIITSILNT